MKKNKRLFIFNLAFVISFMSTVFLWAADEEAIIQKSKRPNVNKTFVVETDENTAAESLDRISGQIDLGFASPEHVFKSPDHHKAGPFSREKAEAEKRYPPTV